MDRFKCDLRIKKMGKVKVKGDVVTFTARIPNSTTLAAIAEYKDAVQKLTYYPYNMSVNFNQTYLRWDGDAQYFHDASVADAFSVVRPGAWSDYTDLFITVNGEKFSTTIVRGDSNPATQVGLTVLHDDAVFSTWPDENGKVVVTAHKGSTFVLRNAGKYYVKGEGYNKDALKDCTDWKPVAEFIYSQPQWSTPVDSSVLCSIFKTIIDNQLKAEALKKQPAMQWAV